MCQIWQNPTPFASQLRCANPSEGLGLVFILFYFFFSGSSLRKVTLVNFLVVSIKEVIGFFSLDIVKEACQHRKECAAFFRWNKANQWNNEEGNISQEAWSGFSSNPAVALQLFALQMQPLIFDLGRRGGETDVLLYCPVWKDNKLALRRSREGGRTWLLVSVSSC